MDKNLVNNDLTSMLLNTSKSNLTEISNSGDKVHVGNCLSSTNTNIHQTNIVKKTVPKFSSAMPPPPSPPPTTTPTPQPPPLLELQSDELPIDLNKNGRNSNEINACNTHKNLKAKYLRINWLSSLELVWLRMLMDTFSQGP